MARAALRYRAAGLPDPPFTAANSTAAGKVAKISTLANPVSQTELVAAALSVGRPSLFRRPSRGTGFFEGEFRISLVKAFLSRSKGQRRFWRTSADFQRLEATDKAMVSYFLGGVGVYVLSQKLLGARDVLHFSQFFARFGGTWSQSGPRPDYIAILPGRGWCLVESKGLSASVALNDGSRSSAACIAMEKALVQLGTSKHVCEHPRVGRARRRMSRRWAHRLSKRVPRGSFRLNGAPPLASIASVSGRGPEGAFVVDWFDPPHADSHRAWDVEMSPAKLAKAGLETVLSILTEAETTERTTVFQRHYRVAFLPGADVFIGLDQAVLDAAGVDDAGLPGVLDSLPPTGLETEVEYISPTGVYVRLGASWLDLEQSPLDRQGDES